MNKKIRSIMSIMLIFILLLSLLLFAACENNDNDEKLPKYLYNSHGNYIAFIYDNFIYDKETKKEIAKYDTDKKVFYDDNGYYGEIYNEKYLVYNEYSPYINQTFSIMPYAPYPPIQPTQPSMPAIVLPFGYSDCNAKKIINLNMSNLTDYIYGYNMELNGYAGFYVYISAGNLRIKPEYVVYTHINITVSVDAKYKGYLKTDLSESKKFNSTVLVTISSSGTTMASIYNLQHKNYGFYEEISLDGIIVSVSGSLIKKK